MLGLFLVFNILSIDTIVYAREILSPAGYMSHHYTCIFLDGVPHSGTRSTTNLHVIAGDGGTID